MSFERHRFTHWFCWTLLAGVSLFIAPGHASETLCAVVKIEIRQELTLERQAFEAKMRITNGLDTLALEGVDINVTFQDEAGNPVVASSNPNDTSARFFIRLDSMSGIDDVAGGGRILPKGVAEITWLIIPSQGAGGTNAAGVRYGIGATLEYRFGGDSEQVVVTPDVIRVKPMPLLTLDYFLPRDVFGDDPLTSENEPSEPFNLGVRVSNSGAGPARSLKIESAQPKIVENRQGLLVDFRLLGSSVDDRPVQNSLLADFGDIPPGSTRTARWDMSTSLSGTFLSFEAEYVHSDELGGALTSLLEAVNTHTLVRSVRDDREGKDALRDFLALDGDVMRLYESAGGAELVADLTSGATISALPPVDGQARFRLELPQPHGLIFARFADPFPESPGRFSAWRSDGKRLSEANVWRFRTLGTGGAQQRHIGIFDASNGGSYELRFSGEIAANQPPVVSVAATASVIANQAMSLSVTASDPEGAAVLITSPDLPTGSSVAPAAGGGAVFRWTPTVSQVGQHVVTFVATDGAGQATATTTIDVRPEASADSDGDGMGDDWEREHFGDLARDGRGDHDRDSASDLAEFEHGGNPKVVDRPGTPRAISPILDVSLEELPIDLVVENATRAVDAALTYRFEVFADPVEGGAEVSAEQAESPFETAARLLDGLVSGERYIWRAAAHDGATPGDWVFGEFTFGQASLGCGVAAPGRGEVVAERRPRFAFQTMPLHATASRVAGYRIEIASDATFASLLAASPTLRQHGSRSEIAWRMVEALPGPGSYHWRVVALSAGASATVCDSAEFVVADVAAASEAYRAEVSAVSGVVNAEDVEFVVELLDAGSRNPSSVDIELALTPTFTDEGRQAVNRQFDGQASLRWRPAGLPTGRQHFARVRSRSGDVAGTWRYLSFRTRAAAGDWAAPVLLAPRDGTWTPTARPTLRLPALSTPGLAYRIEIYADAQGEQRLHSGLGGARTPLPIEAPDREWTWWRARIEGGNDEVGEWSGLAKFYVIDDLDDAPPSFEWLDFDRVRSVRPEPTTLRWVGNDPDSNARIDLVLVPDREPLPPAASGVRIAEGLSEDGESRFEWDASRLDDGRYRLYAIVSDGTSQIEVPSTSALEVRTPDLITAITDAASSEGGGTASVTFRMTAPPQAPVYVPLVASLSELTPEPGFLVFDAENWSEAQQVILRAVDNDNVDGDRAYSLAWGPLETEDSGYAGASGEVSGLIHRDDDGFSLVLGGDGALALFEGESTSIAASLSATPTAEVRVQVRSSQPDQLRVSPAELIFTPENARTPQQVSLEALIDETDEDQRIILAQFGPVTSEDTRFATQVQRDLSVTVRDQPVRGFQVGRAGEGDWKIGETRRLPFDAVFRDAPVVFPTWSSEDAAAQAIQLVAVNAEYMDVRLVGRPSDVGKQVRGALTFVAAEAGQHRLPDGRLMDVQRVDLQGSSTRTLPVPGGFVDAPAVFAALQTLAGNPGNSDALPLPVASVGSQATFSVAIHAGSTPLPSVTSIGLLLIEQGADGLLTMSGGELGYRVGEFALQAPADGDGCQAQVLQASHAERPLVLLAPLGVPAHITGCEVSQSFVRARVHRATTSALPGAVRGAMLEFGKPFSMRRTSAGVGVLVDDQLGARTFAGMQGWSTTLRLSHPPRSAVRIPLQVLGPQGAASVEPSSVEFTAENWNVPQPVRLVIQQPEAAPFAATIELQPAVGADARYAGLPAKRIVVDVLAAGAWTHLLDDASRDFRSVGSWATVDSASSVGGVHRWHPATTGGEAVTIDDEDAGYSEDGDWQSRSTGSMHLGSGYRFRPSLAGQSRTIDPSVATYTGRWEAGQVAGESYRWTPPASAEVEARWSLQAARGTYRVLVRRLPTAGGRPAAPGGRLFSSGFERTEAAEGLAPLARYQLRHADGVSDHEVDMRVEHADWLPLAVVTLDGDSSVRLSASMQGMVMATAIRLEPVRAGANAEWVASLPADGQYDVQVRRVPVDGMASTLSYSVSHADGVSSVTVSTEGTDNEWLALGRFRFVAGVPARVTLAADATAASTADAVRFVPVGNAPVEASWTFSRLPVGRYSLQAMWHAAPEPLAADASYQVSSLGQLNTLSRDQQREHGTWVALGEVLVAPERDTVITLRTSRRGAVVADAVRLLDLRHPAAASQASGLTVDNAVSQGNKGDVP